MRPLKLSLVMAAVVAVSLVSCKKDAAPVPASANSISLNFDSMGLNTRNVQVTYSAGYLSMLGIFNSHTIISLVVQKPVVGTFPIGNGAAAATFSAGSADQYMSDGGTITVTDVTNNTVTGTFRLHCVELASGHTCELIDGAFRVTYPGE